MIKRKRQDPNIDSGLEQSILTPTKCNNQPHKVSSFPILIFKSRRICWIYFFLLWLLIEGIISTESSQQRFYGQDIIKLMTKLTSDKQSKIISTFIFIFHFNFHFHQQSQTFVFQVVLSVYFCQTFNVKMAFY